MIRNIDRIILGRLPISFAFTDFWYQHHFLIRVGAVIPPLTIKLNRLGEFLTSLLQFVGNVTVIGELVVTDHIVKVHMSSRDISEIGSPPFNLFVIAEYVVKSCVPPSKCVEKLRDQHCVVHRFRLR